MKRMRCLRRTAPWALLLAAAAVAPACSESVDLPQVLQVTDITTGWYDAGIVQDVEGAKNKLVPSISFRLKNAHARGIASVQINSVFRLVGDEEELGSAWVRGIDPKGLPPGESTEPLVLRAPLGYTSLQPRAQMLQNREFVDARVEVFAKHGSAQWVKVADVQIERQLLTQ